MEGPVMRCQIEVHKASSGAPQQYSICWSCRGRAGCLRATRGRKQHGCIHSAEQLGKRRTCVDVNSRCLRRGSSLCIRCQLQAHGCSPDAALSHIDEPASASSALLGSEHNSGMGPAHYTHLHFKHPVTRPWLPSIAM